MSDYDKGVLADPQAFIKEYVSRKIPILVDPKHKDFSLYRGATLIKPNINELRHAIGEWDNEQEMIKKVKSLLEKFSWSAVLVTRASDGMTLVEVSQQSLITRHEDFWDPSSSIYSMIPLLGSAVDFVRKRIENTSN